MYSDKRTKEGVLMVSTTLCFPLYDFCYIILLTELNSCLVFGLILVSDVPPELGI